MAFLVFVSSYPGFPVFHSAGRGLADGWPPMPGIAGGTREETAKKKFVDRDRVYAYAGGLIGRYQWSDIIA